MSQNSTLGLIIRNETKDEAVMDRVHDTIKNTIESIKALGEETISKMDPAEFDVMINKRIIDAVKELNIEGVSVVPANEAGVDMMKNTSTEERKRILEAVEEMKANIGMPNMDERKQAVHAVVMAMAGYAMTTVRNGTTSGPAEIFHDFGQIMTNSITQMAAGAKTMAGADDKLIPEAAKLLNRIAVISAIKMLLFCDDEQAVESSIDKAAIREDLMAVMNDTSDDRIKQMVETLNTFADAGAARKTGAGLH